ncbi:MAG: BtpA/SgcQ family protein [Candidatus Heimdallarchaeota archaeon]|nr:MAG: BtpA/SgcQ family protein [Candidatus Heimdallarchaeota archaeon]
MFSPRNPLDLSLNPLIGMVHLPPLVKSFDASYSFEDIVEFSFQDAITLEKAGYDAIIIENFHGTPYPKYQVDDQILLLMSFVVNKIISEINIPCGINILRNACTQALTMATVTSASFIRCNVWEGAYITDQGIIEAVAAEVLKQREVIQSQVKILADIHVKHASPLGDFSATEAATNALNRGGADAIIVSGRETGKIIDPTKLQEFVKITDIKPILGSGLTSENLSKVFPFISGAIVGTSIKVAEINTPIDPEKASTLAKAWKTEKEKILKE